MTGFKQLNEPVMIDLIFRNSMIEDDMRRKKAKEVEKAREKEKKKSPKPTRKNIEALERQSKHLSPKHEPKKSTHGKKGWSSRTNLKEDSHRYECTQW